MAYVVGFLWADGALSRKNKIICMQIQKKDADEIYPIFMKTFNWKVKDYWRKTTKIEERRCYPVFTLKHPEFYEFLRKMNFENKTEQDFFEILNTIDDKFLNYFIRGYFDGDGCIYLGLVGGTISFAAKAEKEWGCLISILQTQNIKHEIFTKKTTDGKIINELRINNYPDIINFANFIYSGEIFGLNRKREKFKILIDRIVKTKNERSSISFYTKEKKYICKFSDKKKKIRVGSFLTFELANYAMWKAHAKNDTKIYRLFIGIVALSKKLDHQCQYLKNVEKILLSS